MPNNFIHDRSFTKNSKLNVKSNIFYSFTFTFDGYCCHGVFNNTEEFQNCEPALTPTPENTFAKAVPGYKLKYK